MALLAQLDAYLDAAPRSGADAIAVGPFTMFLHRGPWGYYARPGAHRDPDQLFTTAHVEAVLAAQRERGACESLEWLHDIDPSLGDACVRVGLDVVFRPLLALHTALHTARHTSTFTPGAPTSHHVRAQVLDADHRLLTLHRKVANVSFANPGTAVGTVGIAERDATPLDDAAAAWAIERSRLGHTIAVAAFDDVDEMVGVGSAQPVVDRVRGIRAAELVGIAVLPTHRRRGIASVITSSLIATCRERGIDLIFLSAQDDHVARIYERIGFRRVGTFAEAAPCQNTRLVEA